MLIVCSELMLGNTMGIRQLHRYYLYLLGIQTSYSTIERALIKAHKANILITASASNEGANAPITFPANLAIVICIGAADGKGNRSEFTSYKSGVEKYSTLGVAVSGATDGNERLTERRDGTSTAAPVAAALPHFSLSILSIYQERRIWMVPFTITCASYVCRAGPA